MKVALVFLLAVAFVSASVPARRPQFVNRQQLAQRDLSLNGINQILANLHGQLLPIWEQLQTAGAQSVQDLNPSITAFLQVAQTGDREQITQAFYQLIAELQFVGQDFIQALHNAFQQIQAISQQNGGLKAADRNFLVDMLINAVLGSSSFQNLIKSDPTMVCLTKQGININNDFIMNTISNNAYEFVTVTAKSCIEQNGGLQRVVQTSPVIQFAWKTAKSFGMLKTVRKAIVEKLGAQLGNEVIGYLDNNPHSKDLASLISQISSIIPLDNLITFVHQNLPYIIAYVQANIQQIVALVAPYVPVVLQFVQQNLNEIIALVVQHAPALFEFINSVLPSVLPLLPEYIQTLVPQVIQQIQGLLGLNPFLRAY